MLILICHGPVSSVLSQVLVPTDMSYHGPTPWSYGLDAIVHGHDLLCFSVLIYYGLYHVLHYRYVPENQDLKIRSKWLRVFIVSL